MWVLLNRIRADRREQFERLMESFWRSGKDFGSREDSLVLRSFHRTRTLKPTSPNKDGTYTYVFLMDPKIAGVDYELENLVRRMLPADSAKAFMEQLGATTVGEQEQYLTVQMLPR